MNFGVDTGDDPANAIFTTANFSGASAAQLTEARDLYAVLTGRVTSINGEQRLDENTDEYVFLGLGMQRARLVDYGFFVADTWRWKPNFTVNRRSPLRPPAAVLPDEQQLLEGDGGRRVGPLRRGQPVQPGGLTGQVADLHAVRRGRGRVQHGQEQLGAELGLCLDAWRPRRLPQVDPRAARAATACCAPAIRWATTGPAPRTSPVRSTTTRAIALTANRSAALGNLGTPGSILLRNRARRRPAAEHAHDARLSDDRRHHRRRHRVRPRPAGAVRDDVDQRAAAQGRQQHDGRSALRRLALAAVVADLQLQRDQHRRERLPERVPGRAEEPRGEHRRRPRQYLRLHGSTGHGGAADLPRLPQRPARVRMPATRRATAARTGRTRRSSATSPSSIRSRTTSPTPATIG